MIGQRTHPDKSGALRLNAGEYGKNPDGVWCARPPEGRLVCLREEDVTEHSDGTITVGRTIHGFRKWKLEKGQWRTLLVLLSLTIAALAAPPGILRTSVTLAWDQYPTNQISPDMVLKLYSSTNLTAPMTSWPVVAIINPTNTSIVLPFDAQQRWFFMTASNYWGESVPSGVASVPAPPRSDLNLRIGP